MSAVAEFARGYDFPLDPFQLAACAALEAGRGVLVAAPTGAGKTVVGEFAVHLAVTGGGKCFYTTPIKALSNQKYADLSRRYGAGTVGLLTGDNSINGEAPVVVMTTEVLRNMLFAASKTLGGLGYVVMDEVHYLADRSRGPVWEEVIINLPESVALVSLSATVSNAEEFGDWLRTVRGELDVIVEEHRPVPLFQHVLAGERLYDLYDDRGGGAPPKVNPELTRLAREDWQRWRSRGGGHRGGYRGRRSRDLVPTRVELVDILDEAALLPAIVFIFSRAGCDAAVQQCLNANLRLVTDDERRAILAVMDRRLEGIADADLDALGYDEWAAALELGVASHHAGLLPTFKECVEELFAAGLVKVVFATETLALGINMPARTVAIERMTKWNGETHAEVTPGEYTQLTGRAGRRGIDVEGHAVVVWSPGLEPAEVAGLASTRTYPLRSSFRPSYNMAVNLVRQSGLAVARELLESSFAQFQADRAVVGLAAELHRVEERLAGDRDRVACDCGDVVGYAALLRELSEREAEAARQRRAGRRDAVDAALRRLGPGDVIWVPAGRRKGYALVVDPGTRSGDHSRPLVVTLDRRARRLAAADLPAPPATLGRLRVSRTMDARSPQQRRDLAARLREFVRDAEVPSPGLTPEPGDREIQRLRAAVRAHPSHACPDRDRHVKASTELLRLERDAEALRRRIETRTNTIARQFDRVCELLSALGYLADGAVTAEGVMLAGIYGELDLVVAECLRRGVWSELDAPALAAVLSCVVFESRAPDDGRRPRLPAGPVRTAIEDTVRVWADLDRLERAHRLSQLREPDPGFAWGAHRWAAGEPLDRALEDAGLPPGDFVRWVKQVVDVAGQVSAAAPDESLRRVAREVVEAMRRGVAAY